MYILFDIGGTKTRVAVSDNLSEFETPRKFATPAHYQEGIAELVATATTLLAGRTPTALAGGVRGVLNHERTCLLNDPGRKLLNWAGHPLAQTLARRMGAPVLLYNDAALAALGEAIFGAGKGYAIVAYHTVSTGVGGARIVEGAIDAAHYGFEPGQQVLDIDRSILPEGVPHTLENLVSGSALEAQRGVKPYDIPQDDPVWDQLALYLAKGLKNTIAYWSPHIIVLGGSMIVGRPRILQKDILRHTNKALAGMTPAPPIVDATLADEGGLFGAMAVLASSKKERNRAIVVL